LKAPINILSGEDQPLNGVGDDRPISSGTSAFHTTAPMRYIF
jgi:hypothetical protein